MKIDWTKVGAIAGIIAVIVAIYFGVINLTIALRSSPTIIIQPVPQTPVQPEKPTYPRFPVMNKK